MKRLLSYMKKYRAATALAVFCIVLETFLELIIPLIMADMVDVGIANGDKAYIFEKGLMMAVCAVISMVLGVGSARFAAVCGQGVSEAAAVFLCQHGSVPDLFPGNKADRRCDEYTEFHFHRYAACVQGACNDDNGYCRVFLYQ